MPMFSAFDGTGLAYHESGAGRVLVCVPGGPLQASVYLGDLGGLSAHRRLVRLDLRGTGDSAVPVDPGSYRCDRLVDDVEALRAELGVERVDLLGHSAGGNVAVRYVQRHPGRVDRLVLVTPSVFGVGIEVDPQVRLATAALRAGEPWFSPAYAALTAMLAGDPPPDARDLVTPFWYGRWDDRARAFAAAEDGQRNNAAVPYFLADGAFDPAGTRAALAAFGRPVLVLAGQVDVNSPPPALAGYAALFPDARLVVQAGAGHFPWLDDPAGFAAAVEAFLGQK
ncbi:alpha/beta fold hydrolase [Micromonospora mirobrigensis]|uniref:Pimeloyl-ACP methyl ester carboxylesterase n=1 Tax=Micromonospora mirobrigensis TaxID=262898 RepID=A0A1C4YHX5_9ACTN|nr:alpha/beta hydrolase [Micromonospora mirobrigensis]SCF19931.1 Pimeloyl-ACP methyl ester carboxylesterase [Micromonospora mirobrigensis]